MIYRLHFELRYIIVDLEGRMVERRMKTMQRLGTFFFIYLPLLISLLGIVVVAIGVRRKKKGYKPKWFYIFGGILAMFPLEAYIIGWIWVIMILR